MVGLALLLPLGATANDEDCHLEHNNHFDVSLRYSVLGPSGDELARAGYNASLVDGIVCWTGIPHDAIDSRIIPRGASELRVGYSPYWPGSPADHGLDTACYAGSTLQVRLDGLGWNGHMATMSCYPLAYVLDWIRIPDAPVESGTLRVSLVDDKGRVDSTTFHVL